jgi:hypothetical protein
MMMSCGGLWSVLSCLMLLMVQLMECWLWMSRMSVCRSESWETKRGGEAKYCRRLSAINAESLQSRTPGCCCNFANQAALSRIWPLHNHIKTALAFQHCQAWL